MTVKSGPRRVSAPQDLLISFASAAEKRARRTLRRAAGVRPVGLRQCAGRGSGAGGRARRRGGLMPVSSNSGGPS